MDGTDVEHGLGTVDRPSHSASFHAVLDEMSASPFDHASARSPFLALQLVAGQTLAAEMTTADHLRLLQACTQVC